MRTPSGKRGHKSSLAAFSCLWRKRQYKGGPAINTFGGIGLLTKTIRPNGAPSSHCDFRMKAPASFNLEMNLDFRPDRALNWRRYFYLSASESFPNGQSALLKKSVKSFVEQSSGLSVFKGETHTCPPPTKSPFSEMVPHYFSFVPV